MASFTAQLVQTAELGRRVVGMRFEASEPFARAAGQYVVLTLDEGSTHAFSIASAYDSEAPTRFEIAAARGTSAERLLSLPLGATVGAAGPSGSLVWKGDGPALLVATGTGLSPLRAIVQEQLARGGEAPLVLLFGCRDASEELWGDELRALAARYPRLRFMPSHSQPAAGHLGLTGRVQRHLPALAAGLGQGLSAYLCGHTPMVAECGELLVALGVSPERVHGESY